ncbi:MAG: cupredoxin domain-containing protein [Myxococcota bacterium]
MTRYVFPLLALVALGATSFVAVPLVVDAAAAAENLREIPIVVNAGYTPSRIEVKAGERVRLVFTRTEYSGCTREVVFPELGIRRELPTNQPVAIDLPPLAAGTYAFHCGMRMIHGSVVAGG